MSSGPGKIQARDPRFVCQIGMARPPLPLTDLHLADLGREIYGTNKPTEAQRVSTLRAAHVAGAGRIQRTNSQSSPTPAE
jgi:hypothetical protein